MANVRAAISTGCTSSLAGLLAIAFVAMKLGHVITWSWWLVVIPAWVSLAFALVTFTIILAAITSTVKNVNSLVRDVNSAVRSGL